MKSKAKKFYVMNDYALTKGDELYLDYATLSEVEKDVKANLGNGESTTIYEVVITPVKKVKIEQVVKEIQDV